MSHDLSVVFAIVFVCVTRRECRNSYTKKDNGTGHQKKKGAGSVIYLGFSEAKTATPLLQ